ncbi:MAG TPA: hypothetical protein VEU08_22850, partial [Vicinamibacterales bacterium]|nr:hypothetical protein [Vicinamibacterales bacterium]
MAVTARRAVAPRQQNASETDAHVAVVRVDRERAAIQRLRALRAPCGFERRRQIREHADVVGIEREAPLEHRGIARRGTAGARRRSVVRPSAIAGGLPERSGE